MVSEEAEQAWPLCRPATEEGAHASCHLLLFLNIPHTPLASFWVNHRFLVYLLADLLAWILRIRSTDC